jgi:putative ABC transport system permease protein
MKLLKNWDSKFPINRKRRKIEMEILLSTFSQGLLWAILALGLYITFRILNFADMTAEGSLALGGSVCAVLMINGADPFLSVILAGAAASLAGLVTGILHTKLKIQAILSGIITMIALYSVNIKIMGKANISLLGKNTVFKVFENIPFLESHTSVVSLVINFVICVFLVSILNLFFKTQLGIAVRATGDNEQMMRAQGANTNFKKILALMMSNALCGTAGALISQSQGYADVNMGTGSIVIALSSIVIGEAVLRKNSFLAKLTAVVLGSIGYRMIVLLVLNLGMDPSDLKFFTAMIAAILLSLQNIKFFWGCKKC